MYIFLVLLVYLSSRRARVAISWASFGCTCVGATPSGLPAPLPQPKWQQLHRSPLCVARLPSWRHQWSWRQLATLKHTLLKLPFHFALFICTFLQTFTGYFFNDSAYLLNWRLYVQLVAFKSVHLTQLRCSDRQLLADGWNGTELLKVAMQRWKEGILYGITEAKVILKLIRV